MGVYPHRSTWFTPPDRPVEGSTVYIRGEQK